MPDAPKQVSDRPAEFGIRISNILLTITILILGYMAKNIDDIKGKLGEVVAVTAANQEAIAAQRATNLRQDAQIDRNRERIDNLLEQWQLNHRPP